MNDVGLLARGLAISPDFYEVGKHLQQGSLMLQNVVRAATDPETLATSPGLADVTAPFVASLAQDAILDRILQTGDGVVMPYAALQVNVGLGVIASHTVAEASPKPVSVLSFAGTTTRAKASTIIVASEELLRSGRAPQMIEAELRRSIAAGTNAAFLELLAAAGDTQAGSGSSAAQITTDLKAAMAAIGTSARSRFYLAVSPSTLSQLALTVDTAGSAAFPDLRVTGGEIAGITVMASDSLETSPPSAVLFDASRIAIGDGGVKLDQSRHASVQMDTAPSGASAAYSLFQRNSRGIRAERFFSLAYGSDTSSGVVSVTITSAW